MAEEQFHNSGFSASQLEQYCRGGLSDAERHAIERAALEDPFLAEALEGFGSRLADGGEPAAESARLQARFEARQANAHVAAAAPAPARARAEMPPPGEAAGRQTPRAGSRFAWRIAALVTGVLVAGSIVYVMVGDRGRPTGRLALTDSVLPSAGKKPDTVLLPPRGENPPPAAPEAETAKAERKPDEKKKGARGFPPESNAPKPTASPAMAPVAAQPAAKAEAQEAASVGESRSDASLSGRAAGLVARDKETVASRALLSGVVTNEFNQPIGRAFIESKAASRLAETDENGYFRLSGRPAAEGDIVIRAPGYELREIPTDSLRPETILRLRAAKVKTFELAARGDSLQPEPAASERDRLEVKIPADSADAAPLAGWAAFNNYLSQSKRLDDIDESIHGPEIVAFFVDAHGRPGNFRIQHSLSAAHDAEAMRLLREGPAWRAPAAGRRHITRLVIVF